MTELIRSENQAGDGHATIAEAVGLPVEKVTVHVVRGGGSFKPATVKQAARG